ncbi:ABC transporter transmembrane domain-containing protein [Streptomyces sp. NRRL B-1347]|uniref:ABC transporter transmembrane domain-containing protein n=1 Tax=Streptomyces sp. NRRL B-1347 TaxID=1476877 RepID=UPI0004C72F0B|nr:ABC transporter transmembrane domain-containing protein [Streptomyces sp. NRRL B-1347]
MPRTHHTQQIGESDCGPACVRTVLRGHGIAVDAAVLRESVGLGAGGSSMLRLREVLTSYGIDCEVLLLDVGQLRTAVELAGPAVIRVRVEASAHFIVVHSAHQSGGFLVSDPLFSRPHLVSEQDMALMFEGQALVTERPASRRLPLRERLSGTRSANLAWEIVSARRGALTGILALTCALSLVALLTSLYLQMAVDRVARRGSMGAITGLTGAVLLAVLAAAGVQYLRGRMTVALGQSLQRELSERYVGKLLRLPLSFHHGRRAGDLVNRLNDIAEIQTLVATVTVRAAVGVFVVLTVGLYLLWTQPLLLLVLTLSAAINLLGSWLLYGPIRRASEEALQRDATLKAETFNTLHKYESVAAFARREFAAARISRSLGRRIAAETRLGRLENLNTALKAANMGAFTILIAWVLLSQALAGRITIGQVFSLFAVSGYFLSSADAIAAVQVALQRLSVAGSRYRDIMAQRENTRTLRAGPSDSAQHGEPGLADLDMRDLDIFYPAGRRSAVSGFSAALPQGSTALLQGANGSGKSTVLRTAAGLHTEYAGTITVGGADLRNLDEDTLRRHVLYVPEDPLLVAGDVHENLTLGATHEAADIARACHIACFQSVVDTLPTGLAEPVREDGAGLSRGQVQRLGLARALLHNPRIYLFDESFSGIDRDTMATIWRRLMRLDATKLLVSHGALPHISFDHVIRIGPAAADTSERTS